MNKFLGFILGLLIFVSFSGRALANEGVFYLQPVGTFAGKCFATSVLETGTYRILMTCRDIPVAYSSDKSYYVLWADLAEGKTVRLGEVQRGKILTGYDKPFVKLFVTAESAAYPRSFSDQRVMEGSVQEIPFAGKGAGVVATTTIQPTPSKALLPTPSPLMQKNGTAQVSTLGKVLGVVGRIIGIAILVLIIAGVVLTVVTRRKEQ